MPFKNSEKDKGLGNIKLPDEIITRVSKGFSKELGKSEGIKRQIPARLGNPVTGEIFVADTNNGRIYISGFGDEPSDFGTIPKVGIPKELLIYGQPILVRRNASGGFKYVGIDTDSAEAFNEGDSDGIDQSPVTQSQLDWGTLQPYAGLVAVAKGAIYGDYAVLDLETANMGSSPLDTLAAAINIPGTANRAIGVLVQLDPSTSTLSYKQSAEFNGVFSLSTAYALGLLPLRDTGKFRIGYLKLSNGITQFDNASVWTCREDFPMGSDLGLPVSSTDNAIVLWDGTGADTIQNSNVTIDPSTNVMANAIIFGGPTYLNRVSIDSTVTQKTLSGNTLTPDTARRIEVLSQTGAASLDQIDSIATTNMSTGEAIYLSAETNHLIDVRHNFAGGNVRLTSGGTLRLSELVPLKLILDYNGNFVEGLYTLASSGAPATATYITQTADATLTNEQALSSLATGIMKVTTTTGVISSLGDPLPIANGGTNGTTATAGFDNLAPTTTNGDTIYHNGTDNVRLAIGSDGKVLKVVSGVPAWADNNVFKTFTKDVTSNQTTSSTSYGNVTNTDVSHTFTKANAIVRYHNCQIVNSGASGNTFLRVTVDGNADADTIEVFNTGTTGRAVAVGGRFTGISTGGAVTIRLQMKVDTGTATLNAGLKLYIEIIEFD